MLLGTLLQVSAGTRKPVVRTCTGHTGADTLGTLWFKLPVVDTCSAPPGPVLHTLQCKNISSRVPPIPAGISSASLASSGTHFFNRSLNCQNSHSYLFLSS